MLITVLGKSLPSPPSPLFHLFSTQHSPMQSRPNPSNALGDMSCTKPAGNSGVGGVVTSCTAKQLTEICCKIGPGEQFYSWCRCTKDRFGTETYGTKLSTWGKPGPGSPFWGCCYGSRKGRQLRLSEMKRLRWTTYLAKLCCYGFW
jgi:hypothetical protein